MGTPSTAPKICPKSVVSSPFKSHSVTYARDRGAYVVNFKCNVKRLVDYPNLWNYVRDLYQQPRVEATVRMGHINDYYYISHTSINPSGIVRAESNLDWLLPYDRDNQIYDV